MKWNEAMLDALPPMCVKCEKRITKINASRLILKDTVVVRCGHCGHVLLRVDGTWYSQSVGA